MAAIREHPRYTHADPRARRVLRGIVETAADHHERLDGTGYHRGLSAFDLSRPARILAVADIFEALTADRPYREAMPHERALEIVREQRGTGLCPAAVDALERPPRRRGRADLARRRPCDGPAMARTRPRRGPAPLPSSIAWDAGLRPPLRRPA